MNQKCIGQEVLINFSTSWKDLKDLVDRSNRSKPDEIIERIRERQGESKKEKTVTLTGEV